MFRAIRKGKQSVLDLSPYDRGLYYEDVVCRWLKQRGYHILDRNYEAKKRTEIDIVAKDKETLVFIEVKARRKETAFDPLKAIDKRKREALALAVTDYLKGLQRNGIDTEDLSLRFDAVALYFDNEGEPTNLEHYVSYLVPNYEPV
ncbi:MAG: YraN family protein [Clostridia bacterium]|nr:YraN family protein [Clostridia bacterium]